MYKFHPKCRDNIKENWMNDIHSRVLVLNHGPSALSGGLKPPSGVINKYISRTIENDPVENPVQIIEAPKNG